MQEFTVAQFLVIRDNIGRAIRTALRTAMILSLVEVIGFVERIRFPRVVESSPELGFKCVEGI